jgi:hypothetical protein
MRYQYKVMELGPEILDPKTNEIHVNVGESKEMEAMSLKKLQRKLDPKKKYHVEYRNKKNNFISATIRGRDNG